MVNLGLFRKLGGRIAERYDNIDVPQHNGRVFPSPGACRFVSQSPIITMLFYRCLPISAYCFFGGLLLALSSGNTSLGGVGRVLMIIGVLIYALLQIVATRDGVIEKPVKLSLDDTGEAVGQRAALLGTIGCTEGILIAKEDKIQFCSASKALVIHKDDIAKALKKGFPISDRIRIYTRKGNRHDIILRANRHFALSIPDTRRWLAMAKSKVPGDSS